MIIDTIHWEYVAWLCPRCGHDEEGPSRLQLVDSRDFSTSPREVWEPEFDADLSEQREAVEPAVVCPDCETVFDVSFKTREGDE